MVLHFKRKQIAATAIVASALLVAACGSSSGGSSSKANSAQPYAGQTITIEAYAAVPEFDFYKSQMSDFTKKTGI
jgi:ABC-type glycerol-3-phosphate transport system substrate-binding protein